MIPDIFLSIIIYFISAIFLFQGRNLSDGSEFFPRIIIILLLIMSTVLLIKTLKNKPHYEFNNLGRVLLIFGVSLCYSIFINITGFYTTSIFFIMIVMYLLGIKKKKYYLIIPFSVVAFMFIVFKVIFMIPVPAGFII